ITWTAGFIGQRIKITVTDGRGGKVVHGYSLPINTTLAANTPLTIAAPQNSLGYATINVPPNTPVLQVRLRDGTGDADLLVIDPGLNLYETLRDGNSETLSFPNPTPGPWLIYVEAFR